MKIFEQQYLCERMVDHEYELFFKAWTIYHETADRIDGHIKYPRSREDFELTKKAMIHGGQAMDNFLYDNGIQLTQETKRSTKWLQANVEALRRLENGRIKDKRS